MTDTMGRMHSDASLQDLPLFLRRNDGALVWATPMVGASVSVAVAISEAMNK